MTALERVMQLKKEGRGESEIIATLKAEGVNPMEISDSINQSKIKEAINDPNPSEGMSPSIMDENRAPEQAAESPVEETPYSPQETQAYEPQQEQYNPQQEQSYNNSYSNQPQYDDGYDGYDNSASMGSTDTMIEVAEQVFLEKMKDLTKEIKALTEFRTIFEIKVNDLKQRLERMEKNFDKMQLSILEKVGEYGRGINNVKKELQMVEDSVSKLK